MRSWQSYYDNISPEDAYSRREKVLDFVTDRIESSFSVNEIWTAVCSYPLYRSSSDEEAVEDLIEQHLYTGDEDE